MREGGGRKREERKRGRKRASYVRVTYMVEGVMQCIIRRVFHTLTLPLHPPIPGILLVSLVSLFAWFLLNVYCALSLTLFAYRGIQRFGTVFIGVNTTTSTTF